ncbi:anthranilate synthase family protein [Actinophytocola sp.]|uniref:anthranilate synthase family protein n=1 Tax=Actinophytocola sp. TaxID=1872138 RepID=UPI003899A3DD
MSEVDALFDLPLREFGAGNDVLALIPYRQITERGYTAPDDGTPLLAMSITEQDRIPTPDAIASIPETPIALSNSRFDITDEDYANMVRRVITDEIGQGKGANFVIKRSFTADITGYSVASALTLFRRLLAAESGAHWTFIIHTGSRTLVGASPERHVTVNDGVAVMNPISGTYRYPAGGPSLPEVIDFLSDPKETDELFMVVDEELKMMSRVCEDTRVVGPYLKEMSRLAHTEYFIEGHTEADVRDILRETLFAPTVTGSPLESASQVIAAYEPEGRGYYSGVAALIGRDEQGRRTLDSTILIRTADISATGEVRIGVGATLVRHSNPMAEVAETKAKAAGVLAALTKPTSLSTHPEVQQALASRNETIAPFWRSPSHRPDPTLTGRRALVVDAEDTFTAMLAHQLRALGLTVTIRRHDEPHPTDGYDLVVMGPGPGDPRDAANPKIAHLRGAIRDLLMSGQPFLAVCLSHQVLSSLLGLPLLRRETPNQGVQKEITLFGLPVKVGFYNTFASHCETPVTHCVGLPQVEVSHDEKTGEVHALRSTTFSSVQFHPESILSPDGLEILRNMVKNLLVKEIAASA